MKKLLLITLVFLTEAVHADIFWYFREENGDTNWQYVANTSAGLLIIALSLVIIRLYFTRRQARHYNRQLEEIKTSLEERVINRTEKLNNSNAELKKINEALEKEISKHLETTRRLRISESYIAEILRSMPLMLVGLDNNNNITQWNRRAEEISGVKADDAIGKNLWDAYPTITVHPQQVQQAVKENKAITVKHCQRGKYHFDITIYPLEEESETGVVVLIDDVTQRILAENMLVQRDKMSSMGELAATMAHDINLPLQTILDDLRRVHFSLAENTEQAEQVELLKDATTRGLQVASIIKNLLSFASEQGGEKKICRIESIIDHAIELGQDVLSDPAGVHFRDIVINRKYARHLPDIPCLEAELQQVFMSLFRHCCNAFVGVKREAFNPTINIEVMEAYDNLWIKVSHNGRGVSIEDQQFIFEPFFNNIVDRSSSPAKRLSFAHFIITEQHKGEMAVTSDVDVGTTFHIQLPLQ